MEKATGLQTMSPAMAEAGNYYRWIADQIQPVAGQCIVDVGGGMGSLLGFFLDRPRLFAVDIAQSSIDYLQQRFNCFPHVAAILGDVTDPGVQHRLIREQVDTLLCTNVLEHVENDRAMLTAFRRILKPAAGKLALMVPAHQPLYGSMDELAGHYRRYNKRGIRALLESTGFRVLKIRYMNAFATIGWWLNGTVFKKANLADPGMNRQILLFDRYGIPLLRRMEAVVPPPFGLSVLALAETGDV